MKQSEGSCLPPDSNGLAPFLDDIFHLVCKHGASALQAILEEADEAGAAGVWGYYFSFLPDGDRSTNLLNQKAFVPWFLQGRRPGFADGLSGCYGHILNVVRDF